MIDRQPCFRFAARLEQLVKPPGGTKERPRRPDLGTLAFLRRGLGRSFGESAQRDGWVLDTLQKSQGSEADGFDFADADLDWACCVASLFASHRISTQDRFASAFRNLWKEQDEAATIARRFAVLLECDARDLPTHLRHAVSLLKTHETGLDWANLLFDLTRWNDPDRRVHRRWSRDFWTEPRAKRQRSQQTQITLSAQE